MRFTNKYNNDVNFSYARNRHVVCLGDGHRWQVLNKPKIILNKKFRKIFKGEMRIKILLTTLLTHKHSKRPNQAG